MKKVAFYIMNSKGYFVLKNFIDKFGSKNIEYVVSSIDRNIKKDYFEEIENLAIKFKINFFNRFDSFLDIENSFQGYKISIGWRWLIKNELCLIIFHDSLLPKYRGFAPLVNALINQEKILGVTALFASSEYDKGNIISQQNLKISYPIKIDEVIKEIEHLYFNLVENIYRKIVSNKKLKSRIQNENKATYSLWLDNKDYFVDWTWSAKKIKRFIDAVGYPYDSAKAYLNDKIVRLINVKIVEDVAVEHRDRHIGKVIFIKDGIPVIVCKKGLIRIEEIRNEKDEKLKINFRSRLK